MSAATGASNSEAPRPIYRRPSNASKPTRRPAKSGRPGSGRSRPRGCRYDVHWTPAIVLEKPTGKKGQTWRVGLADGRILPLSVDNATAQRKLTLYDVVLTRVTDS